jgi:hypothetical protein
MWPIFFSAASRSAASWSGYVSADPAPDTGLMMSGNPKRSAASQHSFCERTRACRGVRMPAASSTRFISTLSRKGTVSATLMPGTPSDARTFAARIMPGSQRHSTRSIVWPLTQSRIVRAVASSSHRFWTDR